jgi:methionyl aminopeptidase
VIILKSPREIEALHRVNQIGAEILEMLKVAISPGISTKDLEEIVDREVEKRGVVAAFRGVQNPHGIPFPSSICSSLNDEVVHGIPNKKMLKEGDLLSIDFGVLNEGFYGDAAISVAVGKNPPKRVTKLIDNAWRALDAGIKKAIPGNRLGDISSAVQEVIELDGYNVVKEFVGHGIGRNLHEEPQVPNFGKINTGILLKEGMVIAIEPMINDGSAGIKVDSDGWTARTTDGSLAAHTEHSIAITKNGPIVLSSLEHNKDKAIG